MHNRRNTDFGIGLVLLMVLLGLGLSKLCSGQDAPGPKTHTIKQGQIDFVLVDPSHCGGILKVFEKTYRCRPDNRVIIGVHMAQKPSSYELKWMSDETSGIAGFIEVQAVNWPRTKVRPPKLRTADAVTRNLERAEIGRALSQGFDRYPLLHLTPPLTSPLDTMEATGEFGRIREFTSTWTDQHKGMDLRAAIGTKVMSIGSGIVTAAKHYSSEGNTVIIYHGDGVYSLYLHLSKLMVKAGDEVKAGQIIALSGDTGNSGGPHLHWAVYVQQMKVDPDDFISGAGWAMTKPLLGR